MRRDRGFTFLAVMFSIFLIGIFVSAAAKQWGTIVRREKEAELLFRGQAIRRAIELYYRTSRPGLSQYPRTLEDLVKDPGSPAVRRYLRKVYPDPITGGEWVLVKDANDRVKGVHSASEAAPLKTAGFPETLKEFEKKEKYSEWVFQYDPKQLVPGQVLPHPVPPATSNPSPSSVPR
jgi:type II secretory pathway pseudopilin PulG